jgi:hypothetical protein
MTDHAGRPVRNLAQSVRTASDAQLLRLVAVLDRLPERGAADAVLDPVRRRLKALRPDRPLTLQRLLFLPFDGIIVPPRDWRGDGRSLPRHALAPLSAGILASTRGIADAMADSIARANMADQALVARIGAQLWPAAAVALPKAAPPGWEEAGLLPAAFARLRPLLLLLWRHGTAIHALRIAGADGPPEDLARPVFRALAAHGSEAVEIGLAAVLPAAARPARLIALVAGMDGALAVPAERALDHFLTALTVPEGLPELARAVAGARRFTALVEELDQTASRDKPRRAQILQALRSAAAENCTAQLEAETRTRLLDPLTRLLAAPAGEPAPADDVVEQMEAEARALRALADTSRRLDPHGRAFAEGLREAKVRLAAALPMLPSGGQGFGRADALRLVEILSGSEAAADMGERG